MAAAVWLCRSAGPGRRRRLWLRLSALVTDNEAPKTRLAVMPRWRDGQAFFVFRVPTSGDRRYPPFVPGSPDCRAPDKHLFSRPQRAKRSPAAARPGDQW